MNWVDRVVEALQWNRLSIRIAWDDIESELRCALPEDFKEVCEIFGRGTFSGFLEVASSSGGSDSMLRDQWYSLQRIVEVNSLAAADILRFGVYRPGSAGLLPWADTYSECQIYWLADPGPSSAWPIVVQNSEGEWSEFRMSASEFIFKVLVEVDFPIGVAEYGPPYYELVARS
ncbi:MULTISPECIES: SMI1/KNR4 family protein [unclassified Streptomyces]|uniref:SMI1/KNR4 family protein n=1 Tax=unclassified Streptomyces TaxID=2593676 RepID=UPI0013A6CF19|nr:MULTISPECIES: SMI1/KNR4 family protein [unclassified Streptomyces]